MPLGDDIRGAAARDGHSQGASRGMSADLWAGLLFVAFGAAFIAVATRYEFGSAAAMGPGFFPIWLGAALVGLGFVVALSSTSPEAEPVSGVTVRPALIILAGLAAAALLLDRVGLVLAGLALLLIASRATGGFTVWQLVLFSAAMLALVVAIFVYGLGLPIPLWPVH